MSHPTKFEIMRARRAVPVRQKIDQIEAELEREWAELQQRARQERAAFDDTADWVADTRKQAREQVKREPEPGTVRVLLHMLRSLPRVVLSRGA